MKENIYLRENNSMITINKLLMESYYNVTK